MLAHVSLNTLSLSHGIKTKYNGYFLMNSTGWIDASFYHLVVLYIYVYVVVVVVKQRMSELYFWCVRSDYQLAFHNMKSCKHDVGNKQFFRQ